MSGRVVAVADGCVAQLSDHHAAFDVRGFPGEQGSAGVSKAA